jgi:hypothetical protein
MRLVIILSGLVLVLWSVGVSAQAAEPPLLQGVVCDQPPPPAELRDEQERIDRRRNEIASVFGEGRVRSSQERRELRNEWVRLQARNRFLAQQRAFAEQGQCVAGLLPEPARRAALQQVDQQIIALHVRAAAVPRTVPFALTLAAGIPTLVLGGTALLKWLINASSNDGADYEIIDHDRRVNRTLATVVAPFAAATLASAIWLGVRNSQRRSIMRGKVPLEQERKRIEATIAPKLGQTSLGLSLHARF